VFAREKYGIRVTLVNRSDNDLRHIKIKIETFGNEYSVPDLAAGKRERLFVQTNRKSHLNLEFTDSMGHSHVEPVVFYAAGPECGDITIQILPESKIDTPGEIDASCWKSWFAFL
jgi:hypothetical protein